MARPILIASNNAHKLKEFRGLLEPHGFVVVSPSDREIVLEVEETGATFEENASLKADAFCRTTEMLSLADDSGLVVDALGGEPGVYSARYGGAGLDDRGRVDLVLERLKSVAPGERRARFVAVIAVARPGLATCVFEGVVEGEIGLKPKGANGFGYDPIFLPVGESRTFAEMTEGEKGRISHRARAVAQAIRFLTGDM